MGRGKKRSEAESVCGVKKETKLFPVGFQRAFPISNDTNIHQFQYIHKSAAKAMQGAQ
jgi:hypothetical protein